MLGCTGREYSPQTTVLPEGKAGKCPLNEPTGYEIKST